MLSFSFRVFTIVSHLCSSALALHSALEDANSIKSPDIKSVRSTNTCADPSLAQTIYESFSSDTAVHILNNRWIFENFNSLNKLNAWTDIHPEFRAWPTQQNLTVPLFQLGTTDGTQYFYKTSANAQTPPVVSGFLTGPQPIAWVYDTPVCSSVPLLSALLAASTDRYFTTNQFEHDKLLAAGWTDGGVVAYVLPL